MTTTYSVESPDGPGRGIVHLTSGPIGPAGPAPLIPVPGVVCWFDPRRIGPPTDIWVDLDEVADAVLADLLGLEGPVFRQKSSAGQVTVDEAALAWLEPGYRLAALELARAAPTGNSNPDLWAAEAALLRATLEDFGFERPDRLDQEVAAMLPALDVARLSEPIHPVLIEALALAHELADPSDDAYLRLPPDDGVIRSDWSGLAVALDALDPAPSVRVPVTMGRDDDWSLHDLLWFWLPADFYPDGEFGGRVVLKQQRQGLRRQLEIELSRPPDCSTPLFVRLVTATATDPTVVAVDAMLIDDGRYVSKMAHPPGVVDGELRVEILSDLNTGLLDGAAFGRSRGQQSGQLALRHERLYRREQARRSWYLAESYHRGAGESATADAARAEAAAVPSDDELYEGTDENRLRCRVFVAESDLAESIDEGEPA